MTDREDQGVAPTTAAKLGARLAAEQSERRLPSVVAGLVRGGQLVWSGSRGRVGGGPSGADVQYRIGSITKTFVAVCVLRLRDEGAFELTDPIGSLLAVTDIGDLTVGALLSQSSGIRAETAGPWWERTEGGDFAALGASSLGPDAARFETGRRFHYSNVGFGVLGALVAARRGAPWDVVVRDELLEPLGMRRTTTRPAAPAASGLAVHPWSDLVLNEPEHNAGAMAPAGQLWSTVEDLARWAAFVGGDGGDLLSAETLATMREPRAVTETTEGPWGAAYGLGLQVWNVEGRRSFGHGGSMPGFLAFLECTPDGDGAVGFANSTTGMRAALGTDLLRILAEEEPRLPEEWRPAAPPDGTADLLGPWHWGPAPHVLRAAGDHLVLEGIGDAGRGARFARDPAGVWIGLDGYHTGEPLTVVRRPDGNVSHLDVGSFVFTRQPYAPGDVVPGGVGGGWRPDGR